LPLDAVVLPGPAKAYVGNYVSLPSTMLKPPVEGNRSVPISIRWTRDGVAPGHAIEFNASSQRVVPISQISALYIDNSVNVSNIVISFPDSNFAVTAPANSTGYYPVVTNGLRFYAFCELLPTANDYTSIQVLNFLPPALALQSGPAQGASLGTVTEIDTLSPVIGGPITTQGTISLDQVALLQVIEGYADIHLTGSLEVGQPSGGSTGAGSINAQQINIGSAAGQNSPGALTILQYGAPSFVYGARANGNPGAPSALLVNDQLGGWAQFGYGASAWGTTRGGSTVAAAENWNNTAQGTRFTVQTTPNGTVVGQNSLVLDGLGDLTILGANAIKPGGGSWTAPSDPALKRDAEPYQSGLSELLALVPISYEYNGQGGTRDDGRRHIGLDAEHARDILPELVGSMVHRPSRPDLEHPGQQIWGPEEEYLTVDPSALIYVLINAVQTLDERVRRLEGAATITSREITRRDAAPRPSHGRGA
jgi:hypothetical protein